MVMAYVLCALLILFTPLMTDLVIPLWDLLDDGSGGLSFWLQTLAVILATLLLIAFAFSWFRQRLSRRTHRAWLTVGVLVFFLGCANLSINSFSTSDTRRTSWLSSLASDDWSEYIEYIDPILATGIVMGPSGDFEYAGIYADFDNDWPIILTNIAVFLLIAKLMLALTSQALCRLRLGNRAKPAPSVTSEPGG